MKLTLPYPPSLNRMYRTVNGRFLISEEGRSYKTLAGWSARAQSVSPVAYPVELTIRAYRPRRAGDLDNCLKVLLDSLNGICWNDDSQVSTIHAYRFEDKSNPRVEVEIRAAEQV